MGRSSDLNFSPLANRSVTCPRSFCSLASQASQSPQVMLWSRGEFSYGIEKKT